MSGKTFHCKTNEGHSVKILGELLQNNIKVGCYNVDEDGISMKIMDSNKHILINLVMSAENFTTYKVIKDKKITFGLNHAHFYKMLRSIKKKDSVSLFIDSDKPNSLGIEIIPKEKNRVTTSYITLQNMQNLNIDIPDDYGKPVIIPSSEFQKMIKDMNNIYNTITVISKHRTVSFQCDADGVYSRNVSFGEEDLECEEEEVTQTFDTEILTRISKIAGLNTVLQIHQKKDLPMRISSNIGNLGTVSIYIKSKQQIEEDENTNHDSEDDEQ